MKVRHFSMLRDFHVADWLTLANAMCGTGAIFMAMRALQDQDMRWLLLGAGLIPLAFVFDALDGRRLWVYQRPGDALTLAQASVIAPFRNTLLVAQGIAAAPEAFLGLLKGRNFGKQLVKLI